MRETSNIVPFPASIVEVYANRYGKIPKEIGKFVANTGQWEEFDTLLKERLKCAKPVTDWQEFIKPFGLPRLY